MPQLLMLSVLPGLILIVTLFLSFSQLSRVSAKDKGNRNLLSRLRQLCTGLSALTRKKGTDVRKTPSTHCTAFLASVGSDVIDRIKIKQRCHLLRQRNEVKCPFNLVDVMDGVFPSKEPFSNNEYLILGAKS